MKNSIFIGFVIGIIIGSIIIGVVGSKIIEEQKINNYIDDRIENKEWAREIAKQGVIVVIEDIPDPIDKPEDHIQGQAWFKNGVPVKVIIDSEVPPEEIDAVGWHEAGHVWYEKNDPANNNEANADKYAIDHGYYSHDKYNGIH